MKQREIEFFKTHKEQKSEKKQARYTRVLRVLSLAMILVLGAASYDLMDSTFGVMDQVSATTFTAESLLLSNAAQYLKEHNEPKMIESLYGMKAFQKGYLDNAAAIYATRILADKNFTLSTKKEVKNILLNLNGAKFEKDLITANPIQCSGLFICKEFKKVNDENIQRIENYGQNVDKLKADAVKKYPNI